MRGFAHVRGDPGPPAVQRRRPRADRRAPRLLTRRPVGFVVLDLDWVEAPPPMLGLRPALARLAGAGLPLAVASSGTRPYVR
jgi:phosphoglycolate phosphatase-like HAD superfamily hydrolase